MQILLDTTIQIDRIFKRDKKERIQDMIEAYPCGSSTYVLGEYNKGIVKNFVTLYNIMQIEQDLAGVRDKINDSVFNRDYQRIRYVLDDLCKIYNDDYELIKDALAIYSKTLIKRFMYGLEPELLDTTNCHRANAKIKFEDGVAILENIECDQKRDLCNICEFWQKHLKEARKLSEISLVSSRMKSALEEMLKCGRFPKGNRCKTLGDCVIAIEALNTDGKQVCTTNTKDFKPICDCIGVGLYEL